MITCKQIQIIVAIVRLSIKHQKIEYLII